MKNLAGKQGLQTWNIHKILHLDSKQRLSFMEKEGKNNNNNDFLETRAILVCVCVCE